MTLRVAVITLLGAGALVSGEGAVPRRHVVEIRGMAFAPAVLRVARGDTVIWVDRDIVPHTATAPGAWDTGTLVQEERGVIVSRRPGRLEYGCRLHPTMKATLVTR